MNESLQAIASTQAAPELPDYLVRTYAWAYLRPANIAILDRPIVYNSILWGNYARLAGAACDEFAQGERVLQAASAYGDLSLRLLDKLGPRGFLDVIDVAPVQVSHLRRKLGERLNLSIRVADAATPCGSRYDGVCCYFLLHEIPNDIKRAVVSRLLECIDRGGRVVFVDYARPGRLHPLWPLMSAVFRWFEPYAEGLLSAPISSFAIHAERYKWSVQRYFGGLFQKVVATRT